MPLQEVNAELLQKMEMVDEDPVFRELVAVPAVEVDDAHVGVFVARRRPR